jgi:hypothetical protein
MADIRIKDLTTTASSTASDDFIAVDGTTNGTRKLNAFSPTFGGNATVTGTLTVNGTSATVGSGTGSIVSKLNGAAGSYKLSIYQSAGVDRWYAGLAAGAEGGSDGGAPYSIVALTDAGAVIDNALLITRAAGGSITTPRPVAISSTTASTTTSTGALVVGGGLGVGGAVNIGGTGINVTNSGGLLNFNGTGNTTAIKEVRMVNSGGGDWMAIGMTGSAYAGVLTGLGNDEPFIYAPATFRIFRGAGLTNRFDFAADQLKINATTASTSTSSGALVVSGGVGVAGASTFGATVTIDTAGGMLRVVNSNSLQPRGLVSDNVGNFENSGTVHLRKARGTESAKTAVLAGDSIGNVAFSGWDGTAYQLHEGIFQVRAAENFGTGHYGTYMQWQLIKANTGYTVYEAMRLTDSGNLLLGFGDNPTEGTGRIQLAAGASGRASGLGFANDTWLYRSGANTLMFDTAGNAAVINVRESGTLTAAIGTVTGDLYLQTQQAGKKVYIKTANAATAATFDENQKATFAATIKTAAPTGGTAAEWKLGTVATVSPTSPNRTIEVDIGGTIYYIHAKTTNN